MIIIKNIFKRMKTSSMIILSILAAALICGTVIAVPSIILHAAGNNIIAEFSVFSSDGNSSSSSGSSLNFTGHAFIVVKNTSSSSITVGKKSVPANETVSLGTWGNKAEHDGLWYNLESWYYHIQGAYSGRVSLTMSLTSSQLSTLNTEINDGDSYSLLKNCSTFAQNTWNSISSIELTAGWIDRPSGLKNSIKKHDYTSNQYFGFNYDVGYYNGSTFVSVSTVSLSAGVGNTSFTDSALALSESEVLTLAASANLMRSGE